MPTLGDVRDSYTVQVSLQDDVSLAANKVSNSFDAMTQRAGQAVDAHKALAAATGAASQAQTEFNRLVDDWSTKAGTASQQLAAMSNGWTTMAQSAQNGTQQMDALSTATGNVVQTQQQLQPAMTQSKSVLGDYKAAVLDTVVAAGQTVASHSLMRSALTGVGTAVGQVGTALSGMVAGQRSAAEQTTATARATDAATASVKGGAEAVSGLGRSWGTNKDSLLAAGSAISTVAQAAEASNGSLGSFIARIGPLGLAMGGITFAVAAVTTGLVAMGKAYNDAQDAQDRLGRSMQALRDDAGIVAAQVTAAGQAVAASTPATAEAAKRVAATIAAQPNFAPSMDLAGLTKTAEDLAAATGKSFDAAGQQIANALKNTASAAKAAAEEGIKGFDETLVSTIDLMQRSGDRVEAFNAYIEKMRAAVHGATGEVKPLQQAFKDLGETLDPAHGGLGASLGAFITWLETGLARSLEKVNAAIQKIQAFGAKWVPSVFADNGPSGVTSAPGFNASQPITSVPVYSGTSQANLDLINTAFTKLADKIPDAIKTALYGFTSQVMNAESSGQMYDYRGGVLKSSSGALGLMQVMPGTGAQYAQGENYLTPQGNVTTGLNVIIHLSQKYGGDLVKMAIAYNWGEGNADAFFQGLKPGLPQETIGFVGKTTGLSPSQLQQRFGDQINQGQFRQQIYTDAGNVGFSDDTTKKLRDNLAQQQLLMKAMEQARSDMSKASLSGDDDAWTAAVRKVAEYNEKLTETQAAYQGIKTDSQKAADDAVAGADKSAAHVTGLAEKLYDLKVKLSDFAKTSGQPFDQAAYDTGAAALMRKQAEDDAQKQIDIADKYEKATKAMGDANTLAIAYAKSQHDAGTVTKESADYIAEYTKLQGLGLEPGEKFNELLKERLKAMGDITQSKYNAAALQDVQDFAAQDDRLREQIVLIGQSTRVQGELVAEMDERHKWHKSLNDDLTDEQQLAVNAAKANADLKDSLIQQKQAVQELGQMFSSAFDSVANSITDAFVKGKGAAIDFGGIMKGLAAQIAKDFLQLSILNPLSNMFSLGGQAKPTLGTLMTAFDSMGSTPAAGTASSGGSGFGIGNLLSLGGSANSLSGGALTSWIGSQLGYSSVTGLLGTAAAPAATTAQMMAMGSTMGAYSAPSAGLIGSGGSFLGISAGTLSALGAISAGAGLGSMAGGYVGNAVQNALGKTGPAPTIGAGVGALGGAIAGQLMIPIPIVGAIIGGLLGGVLGGGGGGLIGPHAPSMYSSQMMGLSGGMLSTGAFLSQRDPNAQAEQAAFLQQATDINKLLQANNVFISQQKGMVQLGDNTPGGFQDPTKWADLNATNITGKTALQQYRFSSNDPLLSQKLSTQDFATTTQLQTFLVGFSQAQAQTKEFLSETTAMLKNLGVTTGSVHDTITQLNAAYDANKTAGDALINSGFLSSDQVTQMVAAENQLSDARDRAVKATVDAANAQITATDQGLTYRQMTAQASISGSARDAVAAQLFQFDAGTQPQRDQLSAAMVSLYGDTIKNTQGFADQMAMLETTLAKERLAIVTQGNAQIAAQDAAAAAKDATGNSAAMSAAIQTAQQSFQSAQQALTNAISGQITKTQTLISATQNQIGIVTQANTALHTTVDSLHQFNQSLATSAVSPLSPQKQLAAAQTQFATDLAAAKKGDLTATQNLQSDASTYLQHAQSYYGSATQGYQTVYAAVVASMTGLETTLRGQATGSDQQLAALNQQLDGQKKQLGLQQQQLAVAQTVGTQAAASIEHLNTTMLVAFKSLQDAYVAAGQHGSAAGMTPAQAQASLRSASLQQAQGIAGATQITDATSALAALDQIQQLMLGRPTLSANRATRAAQLMSGQETLAKIIGENLASAEYKQFWGLASGGWVGNGQWGKDSVLAQFASGGQIALAGGEFVVSAPSAARYRDMLPAINNGSFSNDNAAMLSELRQLRTEVARLGRISAQGSLAVRDSVDVGTRIARYQATASRLRRAP